MKKLIFILIVTIFSYTAISQIRVTSIDLKGVVISAIKNEPISDCYVSIKGSSRGEITDSLGKFLFKNLELNHNYIFSISAFGYDVFDTSIVLTENINPDLIIKLNTNCNFNANSAKEDIRNGEPKLLIVGSIAPIANSKMDNEFEMKYGIKYYDFGCTPPADACIEEYNKIIFQYLTKKFGSEWKETVRKDVCFLEK
jgi:hypothetical protein